jgi:PHD/YefM family antitoxin component YafN of YafNO toxin-antitoxin module
MPAKAEKTVSLTEFRKKIDKYVAAARRGSGPVAVTDGDEVVGVFLGPDDYDATARAAIRQLLRSRMTGPTVSHEEAVTAFRAAARRRSRP